MRRLTLSFPPGPPVKVYPTLLWEPQTCVHCERDGVWTCWPGPLRKNSPSSEKELLDAWRLDVGRVRFQAWHPWFFFETSLLLRKTVARVPCFFTFTFPNQFTYSVCGRNLVLLADELLTNWETNIESGLSRCWNKCSRSELPYYSSCFVARFFTDNSLMYFYIQNLHWKYSHE
jgi:hypothetical protein